MPGACQKRRHHARRGAARDPRLAPGTERSRHESTAPARRLAPEAAPPAHTSSRTVSPDDTRQDGRDGALAGPLSAWRASCVEFRREVSMHNRITAVLLVAGALATGDVLAQTSADPAQRPAAEQRADVPVFRVTVVGRTTPAINYRPRSGATTIDFVGTPLQPQGRGHATVKGKDGAIEIDARFNKLQSAARFGPEYLTYVLWAVTPEGRATN